MTVEVTVEPAEFLHVDFEAATIAEVTRSIATDIGLDGPIKVTIDESTPLGFSNLVSIDPIEIFAESGAFENPKILREYSPGLTADVIGRHLLRVKDRRSDQFGDVPDDKELELRQLVAWDTYTVGRLVRLGYSAQRQRRLYQFRNRHGFHDVSDAAFEELWNGEDLTWDQIDKLSADAAALNEGSLTG